MGIILIPLYNIIDLLLQLYWWAIIISVILSWLLAFGVVNSYSPFISRLGEFLFRITEPLLGPLRQNLPSIAGLDISPFVLLLIIYFVQAILLRLVISLTS